MIGLLRPITVAALLLIAAPARADVSFLEAGFFFVTAVDPDPRQGDVIDNGQIDLPRYNLVAYLVSSNPCAVRIRTTTKPYFVWQIDFCKITHYQATRFVPINPAPIYWFGERTGFCTYRDWDMNLNYDGPINMENATCAKESGIIWTSLNDVDTLLHGGGNSRRSIERMVAAFRYIVALLSGKPY